MTDHQQAIASAVRLAVLPGGLSSLTMGQVHRLRQVIEESTPEDFAAVVARLLTDALDQVIVQRLHPSKREPPNPRRTRQDEA